LSEGLSVEPIGGKEKDPSLGSDSQTQTRALTMESYDTWYMEPIHYTWCMIHDAWCMFRVLIMIVTLKLYEMKWNEAKWYDMIWYDGYCIYIDTCVYIYTCLSHVCIQTYAMYTYMQGNCLQ
jgi:hypothetical protein